MLKILSESLIINVLESNKNINNEVEYIYSNLNKEFISDIEKEIKVSGMSIEEYKMLLINILNDIDFQEELIELGYDIPVIEVKEVDIKKEILNKCNIEVDTTLVDNYINDNLTLFNTPTFQYINDNINGIDIEYKILIQYIYDYGDIQDFYYTIIGIN